MSLRALGRPGRRAHLGVFGAPTAAQAHPGSELGLADRISPTGAILAANLGVKPSAIRYLRPEELVVEAALAELAALADKAAHLGGRLVSLFASDQRVRMFYVHQGIEKRFERLSWRDGLFVAESVSGDTTVGHALAYAHAIERLAGVDVPARARALRVVLLELERIYNHVADIVVFATNRSLTGCASRALAMREGLARHLERLFVTRLLRGTVALGGVKHDLSPVGRQDLLSYVHAFEKEFDQLVTFVIDARSFTDRADGTVILTNTMARELGMVGMAARASGIDADLRRDHPHDAYDGLRFEVPVEETGDVRARLMLRAREVEQSLSIVRQVLETLPETPLLARLPDELPAFSSALGWAEAWRGPCFHWVATDERGGLSRVKVTDASSFNWPGLVEAVLGGMVSGVPVINGRNVPYSGDDR